MNAEEAMKAINTRLQEESFFRPMVGNRIFLDEAPKGTATPYSVVSLDRSEPVRVFSGGDMARVLFGFLVVSGSTSAIECSQLAESLKTCFNCSTLHVTGWHSVAMRYTSETGPSRVNRRWWAAEIDFEAVFQKE